MRTWKQLVIGLLTITVVIWGGMALAQKMQTNRAVLTLEFDDTNGELRGGKDAKGNDAKKSPDDPIKWAKKNGKKVLSDKSYRIVVTEGSTCIWFQSGGDWYRFCY